MKRDGLSRHLLLACAISALLLVEATWLHSLQPLENRLSDVLLRQHALHSPPDPDIVIVDIDERSLALMADSVGRWPWPRSMHAELIEGIARQQPKAIVFDILFSDPDLTRPQDDAYFAEVIGRFDQLYFPMLLLDGADTGKGIPLREYGSRLGAVPGPQAEPQATAAMVLPLPAILATGRVGTHNAIADQDGVVRSYPIYMYAGGWRIPSLPARVAVDLGYALPATGEMPLHWHGGVLAYPRVSYADLYADLQRRVSQRPAAEFKGKIVIIGATATGLHDVRATPVDGFYPGVAILATALDNLKNADSLKPAPLAWGLGGGMLAILLLALAFAVRRHIAVIGLALGAASALALLTAYLVLQAQWRVWVLTPVLFAWLYFLVAAFMAYWQERKTRERAIATFSRFLDPRVVDALVAQGVTLASLGGKSRQVSVLFSDIRGFTTLSEGSTPEQVVELLNAYFTLQAEAVFRQEGTLDKYIGDAIMAFWGAPAEQPDHALRAVAAALDMSDKLEQFRAQLVAQDKPLGQALEIGIGVHSGPAVVGFIGSPNKQEYTAIGDTVNLTSRIEGQTKGICRVLVSEDTRQLCELQANGHCPYDFVDHGVYEVKGRARPVRLFEPKRKAG
ncbi:MAG TPA: adenylate/guanylate cyclase domain-containing protein [Methylophilaceae bacterium]|nr:adenylate/guanylate cyclase domain-containing protein [Methylophilaceae bacterium]